MLTPLLEGLRDSAVVNLGSAVTMVVAIRLVRRLLPFEVLDLVLRLSGRLPGKARAQVIRLLSA